MTDVFEHNPEDHEDPVPDATWLVGFIGVVLLVVVVLGVTSLYFGAETDEQQVSVNAREPIDLAQLNERHLAQLEGPPRWIVTRVDQEEADRQLVIPIEDAMRRIASDLGETIPAE